MITTLRSWGWSWRSDGIPVVDGGWTGQVVRVHVRPLGRPERAVFVGAGL